MMGDNWFMEIAEQRPKAPPPSPLSATCPSSPQKWSWGRRGEEKAWELAGGDGAFETSKCFTCWSPAHHLAFFHSMGCSSCCYSDLVFALVALWPLKPVLRLMLGALSEKCSLSWGTLVWETEEQHFLHKVHLTGLILL